MPIKYAKKLNNLSESPPSAITMPDTMNSGTAKRVKLFIPANMLRATSAAAKEKSGFIRLGSRDIKPNTPPTGSAITKRIARIMKNTPIAISFLPPYPISH